MQLSKHIISKNNRAEIPRAEYFDLPEKVMQLGTKWHQLIK